MLKLLFFYLSLSLSLWAAGNPLLPYAKSWTETCDAAATAVMKAPPGRSAEEALRRFARCVGRKTGTLIETLEKVLQRRPGKDKPFIRLAISELLQSTSEFNDYDADYRVANDTQLLEFQERYERYKFRSQQFLKLDPAAPPLVILELMPGALADTCDERAQWATHPRKELGAFYALDALRSCMQDRYERIAAYANFLEEVSPATPLALRTALIAADANGDMTFAASLNDTALKSAGGPTQFDAWRTRLKARNEIASNSPVKNVEDGVRLAKSLLRIEITYTCSDILGIVKLARTRWLSEFRLQRYRSCMDSRAARLGALVSSFASVSPLLNEEMRQWLAALEKHVAIEEKEVRTLFRMEMDGHNVTARELDALTKRNAAIAERAAQALEKYF